MTRIKICGITRAEEIVWLNETEVAYAGFVFYEKSTRYVTVSQAQLIGEKLKQDIKKVAVTVSPDAALLEQIAQAGFDVIQIHGDFEPEVAGRAGLPIWVAANLSGVGALERWRTQEEPHADAVLFDAGDFGSGRTFGWDACAADKKAAARQRRVREEYQIPFILAGGLNARNIAEGIRLFAPDVVDVSSGVEVVVGTKRGKSREKIAEFVRAVREADGGDGAGGKQNGEKIDE